MEDKSGEGGMWGDKEGVRNCAKHDRLMLKMKELGKGIKLGDFHGLTSVW